MKTLIKKIGMSLKEDNSDTNRKKWAHYIVENNISLIGLVDLLDFDKPVAIRFIWLIGDICELEPKVVYPSITHFYSKRHEVQIPNFNRSLAKMFWLSGIPAEIEGVVIDEMFKWLLDTKVSVSTKNYALFALFNLTAKHIELKNELKIVIEDQVNKNSVSFEKRAKKILEKLN